ncbi:hypothetical protein MHYP_G00064700 [Metynnis hypsauchen]
MHFLFMLAVTSDRARGAGAAVGFTAAGRHERSCGLDTAGFPQLWDLQCHFTGLRVLSQDHWLLAAPQSGMFELSEMFGSSSGPVTGLMLFA